MRRLRIWRWAKRGVALIGSFLALAICLAALYQTVATRLEAKMTPPGVLVDMGGYKLHLYCLGRGSPTIVVIPGVGVWSVQWSTIQNALAKDTRVCTYDRDGYGWSDLPSFTPTAAQASEELHTLLEKAKENGPYMLVGESYGGYVTRLFVDNYREEVSAVVLVESAHERQWDEIPEARALTLKGEQQLRVARWLSCIGFFRFWPMDRGEDLPPNARQSLLAAQARSQTYVAFGNELAGAFTSTQQAAKTRSFGDLPLVVVSARHSFDKFIPPREGQKNELINEEWMRLQDELTRLSTQSLHMVNETATHGIAREQPEYVIAAIRGALQLVSEERRKKDN